MSNELVLPSVIDPANHPDATDQTRADLARGRRLTTELIDLDSVHPAGDQVLVHLDVGVQETPSGLILPPSAQEIRQTGFVLAVGPEVDIVKVGDHVLVDRTKGYNLGWFKNSPVNLYSFGDLFAVLED